MALGASPSARLAASTQAHADAPSSHAGAREEGSAVTEIGDAASVTPPARR